MKWFLGNNLSIPAGHILMLGQECFIPRGSLYMFIGHKEREDKPMWN